jgi:hypothetical protein
MALGTVAARGSQEGADLGLFRAPMSAPVKPCRLLEGADSGSFRASHDCPSDQAACWEMLGSRGRAIRPRPGSAGPCAAAGPRLSPDPSDRRPGRPRDHANRCARAAARRESPAASSRGSTAARTPHSRATGARPERPPGARGGARPADQARSSMGCDVLPRWRTLDATSRSARGRRTQALWVRLAVR